MLHRNMEKSDAKAQFNLRNNAPINPYTLKNEDFNMRELFFLSPHMDILNALGVMDHTIKKTGWSMT